MKGKAYAVKQAKKVLNQYRSSLGDDQELKNYSTDVHAVAENLKISVVHHDFSSSISGVFFKKDGRLYLGVNSDHQEHRQRFTIAHEIGHYILHSEDALHYDQHELDQLHFRADNISSFDETEANHFAAELLMPEELVERLIGEGTVSIKEMADAFNVSEEAMRYRLINLRYL